MPMQRFFDQVENLLTGTAPISLERDFRDQNASGLIEKRSGDKSLKILVFAGGIPAGAYKLTGNLSRVISLADFSTIEVEADENIRTVRLPDLAGRMVWLALESQAQKTFNCQGENSWEIQLNDWLREGWSGLIEIRLGNCHGFALFWDGKPQENEVLFSTAAGFVTGFDLMKNEPDKLYEVTAFAFVPTSQAYQCVILRRGVTHWSNRVLGRYQELVGQKLLQAMNRELNQAMRPWKWNISFQDNLMVDAHFFPYTQAAAHAYRALFMDMGAQMSFVIGNNLTQRILNEAFEQLRPDECAALQAQRLIPAAFSE